MLDFLCALAGMNQVRFGPQCPLGVRCAGKSMIKGAESRGREKFVRLCLIVVVMSVLSSCPDP